MAISVKLISDHIKLKYMYSGCKKNILFVLLSFFFGGGGRLQGGCLIMCLLIYDL